MLDPANLRGWEKSKGHEGRVGAGHMVWPIACGSCVAADYGLEWEQTGRSTGMASVVGRTVSPAPQFQSTQSLGI